jgi:hypothetical protein
VWRGVLEVQLFLTRLRLSKTSNQQRGSRRAHSVEFLFTRYKEIEHSNSIIRTPAQYIGSPTLSEFLGFLGVFSAPRNKIRNITFSIFRVAKNVKFHSSALRHRVVYHVVTNVSDELCAPIFRIKYIGRFHTCIIHHL